MIFFQWLILARHRIVDRKAPKHSSEQLETFFFFSGPNNRRFIRRTAEHVKVMHHGLFSESETLGKNMQSQLEALEDVLCENGGEGSSSVKRKKVLTMEKPREADTVLVTSKQC